MAGSGSPRVDFLVGGAQKGGTTVLYELLRRHPSVSMSPRKEPHWFDNDSLFREGRPDVAPYHALYGNDLATRLCGDATPSYCWWPPAAARVRDYNPAMKWVLLLRDPVARAYSQWNMKRAGGREPLAFADAIAAELALTREGRPPEQRQYSYLSRGLYARQLRRLWSSFDRGQTLVLRSERLRDDFTATVGAVLAFLGLEPVDLPSHLTAYEGTYVEPLSDAGRAALAGVFESDVRALERMLGWDLADWLR
ncbi:hypothetical protein BURK1_03495 [Burkholderiales bacterium]|nr:hypothetical protein BURK1_03495 [Burkholderiales bacterium]